MQQSDKMNLVTMQMEPINDVNGAYKRNEWSLQTNGIEPPCKCFVISRFRLTPWS